MCCSGSEGDGLRGRAECPNCPPLRPRTTASACRLLARDLLAERPDVLVTTGDPATKALQAATATVPIITMSDDVIGGGLAASMARPGGNTTGVSILATELDGKRLEILHECVPQRRRIGVLVDATTSSSAKALDSTAHDLGLELLRYAVRDPREIRHVLDEIAAAELGAINVLASPMFQQARAEIVASLNAARLPAIYQWPDTANRGRFARLRPTPNALLSASCRVWSARYWP